MALLVYHLVKLGGVFGENLIHSALFCHWAALPHLLMDPLLSHLASPL